MHVVRNILNNNYIKSLSVSKKLSYLYLMNAIIRIDAIDRLIDDTEKATLWMTCVNSFISILCTIIVVLQIGTYNSFATLHTHKLISECGNYSRYTIDFNFNLMKPVGKGVLVKRHYAA